MPSPHGSRARAAGLAGDGACSKWWRLAARSDRWRRLRRTRPQPDRQPLRGHATNAAAGRARALPLPHRRVTAERARARRPPPGRLAPSGGTRPHGLEAPGPHARAHLDAAGRPAHARRLRRAPARRRPPRAHAAPHGHRLRPLAPDRRRAAPAGGDPRRAARRAGRLRRLPRPRVPTRYGDGFGAERGTARAPRAGHPRPRGHAGRRPARRRRDVARLPGRGRRPLHRHRRRRRPRLRLHAPQGRLDHRDARATW